MFYERSRRNKCIFLILLEEFRHNLDVRMWLLKLYFCEYVSHLCNFYC